MCYFAVQRYKNNLYVLFRSAKVQKQLRFCHKLTKTDYQLRLLTAKEVAFL